MEKLYEFNWEIRRMGTIEGIFVAEEKDVKESIGKFVYFGEVLGKHSEISGNLEDSYIKILKKTS